MYFVTENTFNTRFLLLSLQFFYPVIMTFLFFLLLKCTKMKENGVFAACFFFLENPLFGEIYVDTVNEEYGDCIRSNVGDGEGGFF